MSLYLPSDETMQLYSLVEPFAAGRLRVADGSEIYWQTSGAPGGKPALYLHGGPGSGLRSGGYRRWFDPEKYMVVGIDQRGCGRSRPLVVDALSELRRNTTQTLIDDIEAVRRSLGVERWLVAGASWGTTLALAYAQAHPERVSEMALVAVTTTSRDEIDWITEGVGRIFPEAWAQFEQESSRRDGERLVEAYARRLATGDRDDRLLAARAWNEWEAAHISIGSDQLPIRGDADEERDLVFATLVTHYWANDGFLRNGMEIDARMSAIRHIPAVLIHGRRDVSGPSATAWRLHRSWPASRLFIVESEGHGGPQSSARMRSELDRYAGR
jgi:proline iminopeptidase